MRTKKAKGNSPISVGNNVLVALGRHTVIGVTAIFAFAILFLSLIPMQSINLYYQAHLSDTVPISQSATFKFDNNPGYKKSSTQHADIQYAPSPITTLRVDPLNKDSRTLSIRLPGSSTEIKSFDVVVRLNDKTLYTVMTIQGADLLKTSDSESATISLTEQQLQRIQSQAQRKSVAKLFLLAVITLLYLIVMLRITIFPAADMKYFSIGALIGLLILGFAANTIFIKQPLLMQQTVSNATSADIDQKAAFTIRQPLTTVDDIATITLPVTIDDSILPSDTDNPAYGKVYKSDSEFRDQYSITITENGLQKLLFKGRVTPSMLDGTASNITIPLHLYQSSTPIVIQIVKNEGDSDPTLRFQSYPDTIRPNYLTATSIGLSENTHRYLNVLPNYRGFNYQTAIIAILLVFCIALIINMIAMRKHSLSKHFTTAVCTLNYGGLLLYALAQFPIYTKYVQGFPDEQAHLSYIAYLSKFGGIVPNFKSMQIYAVDAATQTMNLSDGQGFNYLGHPPLYYQIMRFIGGITTNGSTAYYDLQSLRFKSFCIGLLGVALLFYIGYSRIPKIPLLHLLYGLIIISPPNLIYVLSGLNNDGLSLLTVSIFILGIIRFLEGRYLFSTYALISIGIVASFLTKLTAGLMVGIAAVLILGYFLWKIRTYKELFKPGFWLTLPIYAIVPVYFAYIRLRYHTIQPSYQALAYSEYMHSSFYADISTRPEMGMWDFVTSYQQYFINTWFNLSGHTAVPRDMANPIYSIDRIAVILVLLLPFVLFFMKTRGKLQHIYLRCMLLGILVAFAIQTQSTYRSTMDDGRFGGYSSRYYLCMIGVFALSIMWMICTRFLITQHSQKSGNETLSGNQDISRDIEASSGVGYSLTRKGTLICVCFSLLLLFDGFIYSVLYQAPAIQGFTH